MDPLEERDIEKVLSALNDFRVQEKIATLFVAVPGPKGFDILVPKRNIIEYQEEESSGS